MTIDVGGEAVVRKIGLILRFYEHVPVLIPHLQMISC